MKYSDELNNLANTGYILFEENAILELEKCTLLEDNISDLDTHDLELLQSNFRDLMEGQEPNGISNRMKISQQVTSDPLPYHVQSKRDPRKLET